MKNDVNIQQMEQFNTRNILHTWKKANPGACFIFAWVTNLKHKPWLYLSHLAETSLEHVQILETLLHCNCDRRHWSTHPLWANNIEWHEAKIKIVCSFSVFATLYSYSNYHAWLMPDSESEHRIPAKTRSNKLPDVTNQSAVIDKHVTEKLHLGCRTITYASVPHHYLDQIYCVFRLLLCLTGRMYPPAHVDVEAKQLCESVKVSRGTQGHCMFYLLCGTLTVSWSMSHISVVNTAGHVLLFILYTACTVNQPKGDWGNSASTKRCWLI